MYAIIEDGGKQYKVSPGDNLLIETRALEEGQDQITFDQVMMVGEGDSAKIGTPWVAGASVSAKLVKSLKMPKIEGIIFKRRKGHRRKWGHRQQMLRVEITAINE